MHWLVLCINERQSKIKGHHQNQHAKWLSISFSHSFFYLLFNQRFYLFQLRGPAAKSPITKKTHYVCVLFSFIHPSIFLFVFIFFVLSHFQLEEWALDFFRCNFAAKSLKAHVNTRIDIADGKCLPIRVFSSVSSSLHSKRKSTHWNNHLDFSLSPPAHRTHTSTQAQANFLCLNV